MAFRNSREMIENFCSLSLKSPRSSLCTVLFAPNGGNCDYYPSNIFLGFENWEISFGCSPVLSIQSRDAFRPIAREKKYLMDYNVQ